MFGRMGQKFNFTGHYSNLTIGDVVADRLAVSITLFDARVASRPSLYISSDNAPWPPPARKNASAGS
jgi:hypothetical protein